MSIRLRRKRIIETLDRRGWTQGNYGDDGDGPVCLHGAIRVCQPEDAALIEQVWERRGYGTEWNDEESTTENMVRQYILGADPITAQELEATFGPQWEQIVALVRRVSRLTESETDRLSASWSATWSLAARSAAAAAAMAGARSAARSAAWSAAKSATWSAAMTDAWSAAATAAWSTAWSAAALSIRDLITQDHYDALTRPWRTVIGPIHPDDKEVK